MSDIADVAIVGAGFAGLAAAADLVAHGFSVEVFEATDRVGGRAQTLHDEVELGPEFIHGSPGATLDLVRAANLDLEPVADSHHMLRNGQLIAIRDIWERFGKLLEPAMHDAPDESARSFLDRSQMDVDDARLFAMLVEGFYAAPLEDISIRGILADAGGVSAEEGAQQARIRGGYGRLVTALTARLARARVPIHFEHVVHMIDYGFEHVRIDHNHGSSLARRIIVTVPVGVLQAGSVRFQPALTDHAAALSAFAMGQVVKLVLCLREPIWTAYGPADLDFIHRDTACTFPTFWLHSSPRLHQLTAWAAGPHAGAFAGCTTEQLVERAVTEFAAALTMPRSALTDAIIHEHFHDYANDPYAYGAYSYTRVNGIGAADILARPIADRLYFAGEATDAEYEGSVAGAIASGQRAAQQILVSTRRIPTGLSAAVPA